MTKKPISSDFPFESKFLEIDSSKMHYIDEGVGDPILFLHGNPSTNYLWRNIIPYLVPYGRCIAPDLIGMGKSDKPDIDYRFVDHSKYLEEFITKLGLSNITLVIHDWGSALGFHYAMRHENNIKGIAFMEALIKPYEWEDFPKDHRLGFKLFRTPVIGWFMGNVMNMVLKGLLPKMNIRELSQEELDYYTAPYKTVRSRKPLLMWACELPVDGQPTDVNEIILNYRNKLQESELPKILFYASPGLAIDSEKVDWCKHNIKNLKVVDIGEGLHFVQEDNPHMIGEELKKWYRDL